MPVVLFFAEDKVEKLLCEAVIYRLEAFAKGGLYKLPLVNPTLILTKILKIKNKQIYLNDNVKLDFHQHGGYTHPPL